MAKSPVVILYDSNGVAMAVEDGVTIPAGTQALLAAGSDGTDAHVVLVDSNGRPVVVGAGTAGTPAGGVLTVQGSPSGTPIPVSGTFSNPSVGTAGAAIPASATQVGGSDGANLQVVRVFDADSGAGTQYVMGAILRKSASGGSVEAGTSSDPLRVDPTGATTQPVSAASLPLPTGAATEATLATRLADSTFTARINTLGQKTSANSTPVVLASDQSSVPVTDNGGSLTVDGTVTANQGTGAALSSYWPVRVTDGTNTMPTADNAARSTFGRVTDGTNTAAVKAASTAAVATDPALVVAISPNNTITTSNASVGPTHAAMATSSTIVGGSDGTNLQAVRVFDGDTGGGTQYVLGAILRKSASGGTVEAGTATDPLRIDPTGTTTQPISASSLPLPTGAATEATLATRLADATFTGRINTLGQKTSANSTPVVLASDQSAVPVSDNGSSLTVDGTVTSNQGTAAALSGRWPVQVTDGTNTMPTADVASRSSFHRVTDGTNTAAVKAASTAAVATDPALVVAISPNNTITTSNASVGTNNAAAPSSSTQVGGSDGTNLQAARVFDADTGAGSQYVLGAVLRKSASGGSVEAGTSTDPLRIDPTGTTTQPISDAGGSLTVDSTQLPAALVGSRLDVNNGAWLGSTAPTVGSKTSANSIPVVVASDQGAIPVSDNGSSLTVDGTVTANIGTTNGLALDATLTGGTQKAIVRGGAKGATSAADVTSTATGSNHQALDVAILDASGNQVTSFGGGTQYADGTARGSATGTLVMVDDGTNIQSASGDSSGRQNVNSRVTDGTNVAAVKAASIAAVATDPALVVAISPNNPISVSGTADATGTGALGALNAAVQVTTAGLSTVGFQLAAGTLIGTLVPEVSFDGGTTWNVTYFIVPVTGAQASSIVFSASNTATALNIAGVGGSGLTRVRVSSYTSGTANITLRASLVATQPTVNVGTPIHTSATINADGSTTVLGKQGTWLELVINVTATPTGTTPTLTFVVSEMDPITTTTVIGSSVTTVPISAIGVYRATIRNERSNTLRVAWDVSGSSPSFTGVNVTLIEKDTTSQLLKVSEGGHVATSDSQLLFLEDLTTASLINTWDLWTNAVSTMVTASDSNGLNMNSTNVTAANAYSMLTSKQKFSTDGRSTLMATFTARVNAAASQSFISFGFGDAVLPLFAPAGAYFRLNGSTNECRCHVASLTGTSTSEPIALLGTTGFYTFRIYLEGRTIRFTIGDAATSSVLYEHRAVVPDPDAFVFSTTGANMPLYINVNNSGGVAGAAPLAYFKGVTVHQLESAVARTLPQTMAGVFRGGQTIPGGALTIAQISESAPASGVPTNANFRYSTLGGEFLLTAATGNENIRGVFGWINPSNCVFYLTDLYFPPPAVTTAMAATVSIHHWYIVARGGSATPVPAFGGPFALALGTFTVAASATVGTIFNGPALQYSFQTPIAIPPGRYLGLAVKYVSSGNSGAFRGIVSLNGFFE